MDKKNKKVTESSDHYGYEDMNAEMSTSIFRRKNKSIPKMNKVTEDSDNYGYSDTNADKIPVDVSDIIFRKKKNKKPKIKRKLNKRK